MKEIYEVNHLIEFKAGCHVAQAVSDAIEYRKMTKHPKVCMMFNGVRINVDSKSTEQTILDEYNSEVAARADKT